MPFRPPQRAPVGTYRPYHVSAAATKAAAGMHFDGTSATAVASPGSATITLTQLDGDINTIPVGGTVLVDAGSAFEVVTVTGINHQAKTLTATFAQTHSGTYAVRYTAGTYLGAVVVGSVGSGATLTLYNGHPDNGGAAFSVLTPASGHDPTFHCAVDHGLFYTYAASVAGDLTIMAIPALA